MVATLNVLQECTNPKCLASQATCIVAPNIFSIIIVISHLPNKIMYHFMCTNQQALENREGHWSLSTEHALCLPLAPIIWKWVLGFWGICGPLGFCNVMPLSVGGWFCRGTCFLHHYNKMYCDQMRFNISLYKYIYKISILSILYEH